MKLIFIYGPPAVGKLTIAEVLSKRTGIALFHNHLSRDLVADIYNDNVTDHYELVDTIRLNVLDYCSKHGTDLIFTYVYEGKDDDATVQRFIQTVEENKGEVVFVELSANREDLIERVSNESRKRYKKLTNPVILAKMTKNMSNFSIPFVTPLKINTSELDTYEAAGVIAKSIGLVS
ncbi:MAG TPA: AAA family ATPase [Verrucomicrobiae bacterium]|nr:AAA family ATPase [Verrucomicrobiae bacterium]